MNAAPALPARADVVPLVTRAQAFAPGMMANSRESRLRQAQLLFDFRLPAGEWLTFKQIGSACGWSADSVSRAFDEGKLLGNSGSLSAKAEAKNSREHGRVHRDEALLFIAGLANYGLDDKVAAIERAFRTLPRSAQHQLLQRLAS